MKEVIILTILAVVFAFLAVFAKKLNSPMKKMQKAGGVIERICDEDGSTYYFVKFYVNGSCTIGKSVAYPSAGKCYSPGDKVLIKYYFTKKQWARVLICDETMPARKDSLGKTSKFLFCVSFCFFLASFIFAIRAILSLFFC